MFVSCIPGPRHTVRDNWYKLHLQAAKIRGSEKERAIKWKIIRWLGDIKATKRNLFIPRS
jgi:hypothetical protein